MRTFVLALFGGAFAVSLLTWWVGVAPAWPFVGWTGFLFVAALAERWRYRPPQPAGGDWQDTGERFIDPASGREMAVSFDRRSGQRRYTPVDGGATPD